MVAVALSLGVSDGWVVSVGTGVGVEQAVMTKANM
jgi:hypothetical protein